MPAPLGNQFAKGHGCGRPHRDLVALAAQMREWADREDSMNLLGFTGVSKVVPSLILKYSKENEDFRVAYEEVKAIVGERRERKLSSGELHVKAYDLNSKVYDQYLKDEHREEIRYAEEVKAASNSVDEETKQGFNKMMTYIESLQSERKIAPINNSEESKS